jgi:hypothetical protein
VITFLIDLFRLIRLNVIQGSMALLAAVALASLIVSAAASNPTMAGMELSVISAESLAGTLVEGRYAEEPILRVVSVIGF